MNHRALVFTAILLLAASSAEATINKSVQIADGQTVNRSLNSINGSISIGSSSEVLGSAKTINGGIKVGDDSWTRNLSSVNGRLRIGDRVTIDGDLHTVNGGIRSGEGTVVIGGIETVNGDVNLVGTTVYIDLQTVHGSVNLDQQSRIQGSLIIEERHGRSNNRQRPLHIHIRNGSVVEGDIDVLDHDRKVVVHLNSGGAVMGQIRGAEVVED